MDTNEPLDPIEIDVRSPGERMVASGRDRIDRMGDLVDSSNFDLAALVWMLCTILTVGLSIYTVLKYASGSSSGDLLGDGSVDTTASTWDKINALATTGGPVVAIACIVGIALAALFRSAAARFTLWLATLGGAWVAIAGVFLVASALHESADDPGFASFGTNRAVNVLTGFAYAGLGVVVTAIGLRAAKAQSEWDEPDWSEIA